MTPLRDEFLSEEDLDLRNLSEAELLAVWDAWLVQAQTTNEMDEHEYEHGVFASTALPHITPPRPTDVAPRTQDSRSERTRS